LEALAHREKMNGCAPIFSVTRLNKLLQFQGNLACAAVGELLGVLKAKVGVTQILHLK
jgi:hypothetical protein